MPSINKTANYGLNQWQGNEYPQRTDFVNDNAIIDAQLKANALAAASAAASVPTKASQLNNDTGFINSAGAPVQSVNNKSGAINLTASDVGAEPTITGGLVTQYWSGLKTWRTLSADVLATVLTGLSTATNAVITAGDTVLSALGKLQAQINSHLSDCFNHVKYAVSTNSGNTYTATISGITAYTDGLVVRIKINSSSTAAASLGINALVAKAIYDNFGNAVTNLNVNTPYQFCYEISSDHFIALGKGGGGNATASQLLSGATATVNTGPITGTMPNKVGSATIITPSTADQAIPQGYFGGVVGDGKVKGDANFTAANINNGVSIWGKVGTGKKYGVADVITDSSLNVTAPTLTPVTDVLNTNTFSVFADTNYIYALNGGAIYKYNSDLSVAKQTAVLSVGSLFLKGSYLYAVGNAMLYKINISDLSIAAQVSVPYGAYVCADASYVYVLCNNTYPIYKFNVADLSLSVQSSLSISGYAICCDATYVYIACGTIVYKLYISNLSVYTSATFSGAVSICVDASNVYVACNNYGIYKLNANLQILLQIPISNAYAMFSDANYIYVVLSGGNGIYKIGKTYLSILYYYSITGVYSVFADANYVYAGSPTYVWKFSNQNSYQIIS